MIAKAHAIKRSLGMSDDDFSLVKQSATGVASITLMDDLHLRAFVSAIERIQDKDHTKPAVQRRLSAGQRSKILRLGLGVLHWSPDQINAFLKKQTGKENIDWLSAKEAWNVVEALCAMSERNVRHGKNSGYDGTARHKSKGAGEGQEQDVQVLPDLQPRQEQRHLRGQHGSQKDPDPQVR